MTRQITNRDVVLATISGITSIVLWIFASPLSPVLIYSSDDPHITIQNIGYKPATDVTIEFDPTDKLSITGINYTKLSGEIITNYTDNVQRIYHVSHMHPGDRLFFLVETTEKSPSIDTIVRSNEVQGQPADQFFIKALLYLQILLVAVTSYFGYQVYSFVKHFLKRDVERQNFKAETRDKKD